ncbi:MAG: hypothetical protein AAFP68_21820 [Pseudomonadota bacterium]
MLSFVTAMVTDDTQSPDVDTAGVLGSFATAAAIYLLGIFFVLLATMSFAASQQLWGGFWEAVATGERDDKEDAYTIRAFWLEQLGFACFAVAMALFPAGSYFAIAGLT